MSFSTLRGLVITAILGVVGYMVVLMTMYEWIPAGHVGVMYSARTGLIRETIEPKRVFVPWFHQLYIYPKVLKPAIYANTKGEDGAAVNGAIQISTSDKSSTLYDMVVFYRVSDVLKAFDSFGPIPIEEVERQHIQRAAREAANAVGPRHDAFSLMGSARKVASDGITQELRTRLGHKGIRVERAFLCTVHPSDKLATKINSQVNAITELTIADIRRKIAGERKQTAITLADAESRARNLSASKAQGASFKMLSLEADQEALAKWDGNLPPIVSKPGQTIFIPETLGRRALTVPSPLERAEDPTTTPDDEGGK